MFVPNSYKFKLTNESIDEAMNFLRLNFDQPVKYKFIVSHHMIYSIESPGIVPHLAE